MRKVTRVSIVGLLVPAIAAVVAVVLPGAAAADICSTYTHRYYLASPIILGAYAGTIRICIAKHTPPCSSSSDYEISVRLGVPTIGDPNEPDWGHAEETPGGVHYYEDA